MKKYIYSEKVKKYIEKIKYKSEDYKYKSITDYTTDEFTHDIDNLTFVENASYQQRVKITNSSWNAYQDCKIFYSKKEKLYVGCYKTSTNTIVKYFTDKTFKTLHRNGDKPAEIAHLLNLNRFFTLKYYKNGNLHRDIDKPSVIRWFKTTDVNSFDVIFYKNGLIHRENKPAHIRAPTDSMYSIFSICYYNMGNLHSFSSDIPAILIIRKYRAYNGKEYMKNKHLHNYLYLSSKEYYKNNEHHRLNGPAIVYYDKLGTQNLPVFKKWIVNGKVLDRRKFPYMDEGILKGRLKKNNNLLFKATLFDREYGEFLKRHIKK